MTTEIELDRLEPSNVLSKFTTAATDLRTKTITGRDNDSIISTRSHSSQDAGQSLDLSAIRATTIMLSVAGITFVSSMTTGLLATGLPSMAPGLGLSNAHLLWPASIYGLTGGCTFIPVGSIADVVGSRSVYLFGCLFLSVTVIACGLARTGTELIVFRGLQGVAASCCLPTAISILTNIFPSGRRRTRGLALQGAAQPIGYSMGLFLGGLFADTIGWRWGWYIAAGAGVAVFVASIWAIPRIQETGFQGSTWRQITTGIDWVGAVLASICLGLLSYILGVTAGNTESLHEPINIVLLCLAIIAAPIFILWVARQEKNDKPALIPNSVWRNRYFTSICVVLFLASVVLNAEEYFFSLYFQKVQGLSALQSSIRYLPNIIVGLFVSFGTDAVLHKWSTYPYVLTTSILAAIAPLLMGLMSPSWSYWNVAFSAMALSPVANDVLFIVGALIIADNFPGKRQALAGSILSTVYQFGSSVGLGVVAVVSAVVTDESRHRDKESPAALLEGYRAGFWTCLGAAALSCAVVAFGLRGIGKVGLKAE